MSIIRSFIELGSVDSTNNYAMARAHAGMAFQGDAFFAHEQWAGKGQRGKTWNSLPGENIVLSIVLEPVFLPVMQQFTLSTAMALACHDLFSRYVGAEETTIKWPNDLYWRDRKAGGILIENSFKGDNWLFAIAGIGININQTVFPETAGSPVSLKQITGRTFNAVELARELAENVSDRYEQLQVGQASALQEQYLDRLYRRNRPVKLKKGNVIFETVIEGVTPGGELMTRDTLERQFKVGEVAWVL